MPPRDQRAPGIAATLALLLLLPVLLLTPAAAAEPPLLRISTENTASHVQTRVVAAFAQALQQRVGDRMTVEHFPAAALFRDRDVVRALQQGQVEMAVPGTWQIDRAVPDVGALLLPALYGLDTATTHRLRDGAAGRILAERIADTLNVVVPGRWLDLGHAHIYTTAIAVRSHSDLEGLVIRSPGGETNTARLTALGAVPVVVAWPDLPEKLRRGRLNGIVSTHETVVSGRLWEHGLRHAFEDRQYFAQYVPMISGPFWRRLPEDLRAIILDTWDSQVDAARAEAAAAQAAARETLIANGITIITPPESVLALRRAELARRQAPVVAALGLDADLVNALLSEAGLTP